MMLWIAHVACACVIWVVVGLAMCCKLAWIIHTVLAAWSSRHNVMAPDLFKLKNIGNVGFRTLLLKLRQEFLHSPASLDFDNMKWAWQTVLEASTWSKHQYHPVLEVGCSDSQTWSVERARSHCHDDSSFHGQV